MNKRKTQRARKAAERVEARKARCRACDCVFDPAKPRRCPVRKGDHPCMEAR
jgi:hypothetical protein